MSSTPKSSPSETRRSLADIPQQKRKRKDDESYRSPEAILRRREASRLRNRRIYAAMTPEQKSEKRQDQLVWLQANKIEYDPPAYMDSRTADEIKKILGGAKLGRYRKVRGFSPWSPAGNDIALLKQVKDVLTEYADHLPLTVRQVLYRLLDKHGYKKADLESRIYPLIDRARRAELIKMDSIRDDGGAKEVPHFWRDGEHWLSTVSKSAASARLDRQEGQPERIILYCEAAGMVPQLANIADEYGIPVMSSGGFDSITEKHNLGLDQDNTLILHIGDLDPHGIHMFIALAEDVRAFASRYNNEVRFVRLAVTPDQVTRLRLPKSPLIPHAHMPAYPHDFTCQAEAIPPDELARIVREAIDERLDRDAYDSVLEREEKLHAELAERLK